MSENGVSVEAHDKTDDRVAVPRWAVAAVLAATIGAGGNSVWVRKEQADYQSATNERIVRLEEQLKAGERFAENERLLRQQFERDVGSKLDAIHEKVSALCAAEGVNCP